jgi:hypothetical protein
MQTYPLTRCERPNNRIFKEIALSGLRLRD